MSNHNQKQSNSQNIGSVGCMTVIFLIIIAVVVSSFITKGDDNNYKAKVIDTPDYEVIQTEDLSLGKYIRITYWISVDHAYTQEDLKKIAQSIVESEKAKRPISVIGVTFFSDKIDEVTKENIVKGVVDWGPYGEWSKAMEVEPGDYSTHEYTYDFYTHIEGNF
jgi:hypothetical protein